MIFKLLFSLILFFQLIHMTDTLSSNNIITLIPYNKTFISHVPVVVLHGVASSVANLILFSEWLSLSFNRRVFNIEVGNGFQNSLFMPLNAQLDLLCETIYTIPELETGFDFIGLSQGGLLARGYLNKCNKFPIRTLVNIVSPNGGVIENTTIDMYSDFYQKQLSISGYWRDPLQLEKYLSKCSYLPFINNEINHPLSLQYKNRILSLNNYIVVWSPNDETIYPPESAKFSFFNKKYDIIPLEKTDIYMDDMLGLKELNMDGRFHIHKTNCTHTEHRDPICFPQLYDILSRYFLHLTPFFT